VTERMADADDARPSGGDAQTVEIIVESTGHRKFEVPISDVDRDSVSLENAELVEEDVHGDPTAIIRGDTREEVERRD